MDVVAERFIELVAIQHYRELDPIEKKELVESYRELVRRYKPTIEKEWEKAKIRKLIFLAFQTADGAWLSELYDRYQRIEKGVEP